MGTEENGMGLFTKRRSVDFTVAEMNCPHCEQKIKTATEKIPGVTRAKACSTTKLLRLEYSGSVPPDVDAVNRALIGSGYVATIQ